MVLPMATGIMLCTMYLPTETGAPNVMPKGTCAVESLNVVTQLSQAAVCCSLFRRRLGSHHMGRDVILTAALL